MFIRLFLICSFLIASQFLGLAQLMTFKQINHKNGLSMSLVQACTQDRFGNMWFGLDGAGIQRYNGKKISTFHLENGNDEHHVTSIALSEKKVAFSSQYEGCFVYENKKLQKLTLNKTIQQEHLAVQFVGKSILTIGTRSLQLVQNKHTFSYHRFSNIKSNLVELLPITNGLLVFFPDEAYYVSETKIIPLQNWLHKEKLPQINAARFFDQKVELYSVKAKTKQVVFLNKDGHIFSIEERNISNPLAFETKRVFARGKEMLVLDQKNNLYHFKEGKFKFIPKNTSQNSFTIHQLFIDKYGDYWLATNVGVFKISDEPFTKIELSPTYRSEFVSFIYRSPTNDIVISRYDTITSIGNFNAPTFQHIKNRIYCQTETGNNTLFATLKGMYFLENGQLTLDKRFPVQKYIFVFDTKNALFYCPDGKGLWAYDKKTKSHIHVLNEKNVSHVYTAQFSPNKQNVYVGSNNGIFNVNLSSFKTKPLHHHFKHKGSFAGVSCVDSYGTRWFSLDKGLVGITLRGQYVEITDDKHFNSKIFYLLHADVYGNLLIGTHLGISKLQIDQYGNVYHAQHFTQDNGFGGYETHMRSGFQSKNHIYLGTIEGMYSINTEKLQNLPQPPKPFVYQEKASKNDAINSDEDLIKVNFMVINPKLTGIQYSYRLKGKTTVWSKLTSKNEAYFSNLSDQEYIFQVKSTYDGLTFSPISSYKIVKDTPFWKSKWFILLLILSIALANIIVLDRSKSFELSQIIENQNIEIGSKIRSVMLLFGFISVLGSSLMAQALDQDLISWSGIDVFLYLVLFVCFVLSLLKNRFNQFKKHLLLIALFSIIIYGYIGCYISSIHPYYLIMITLSSAATPFILNRLKDVIIFSVLHIIASISIVFLVESAIYHELLFLFAIIVSVSMSLFTTYVRNESFQKLIFISGVVNKGNMLALAYNHEQQITYISENFSSQLGINPTSYLGHSIQDLNTFVNYQIAAQELAFEHLFKDNAKCIMPMKGLDNAVIWISWSCKKFSSKVFVLFGQDVSEQVGIENTYESLVENAEDLIYFVDYNGQFLFANSKLTRVFGYEQHEILGREALFLIQDQHRALVWSYYTEQFQEKKTNTYHEFKVKTKSGHEFWVGQNTTLIFEPGSKKIVKGFLCLARDITEKKIQQQIIQSQNEDITSSITYAKHIQSNLLPSWEQINSCFREFAVFYQAKNIVSGDFYWFDRVGNNVLVVLADCTGHGVPGAFMTLLGQNIIHQLIHFEGMTNPSMILNELDLRLAKVLPGQQNKQVRDGMEVTILTYDTSTNKMEYAAAGGKFLVKHGEKLELYRGESKHIGDKAQANFTSYHTYELNEHSIECVYLFTDGIHDQFSSTTHKKFTIRRLLDNLSSVSHFDVKDQIEDVKQKFHTWKGDEEQTDDITVLAIRF